jgi:hypothetical protein
MNTSSTHNERIVKMTLLRSIHCIKQSREKGRTKEEVHQVIEGSLVLMKKKLQQLITEKVTFETFFQKASINQTLASSQE